MELTELINHPERMDRDTLYELRSMLALHPYFQTARLLMLQNLYLLHDPAFDEELRRAAVYITDRKTIFQMIETSSTTSSTPFQRMKSPARKPSASLHLQMLLSTTWPTCWLPKTIATTNSLHHR